MEGCPSGLRWQTRNLLCLKYGTEGSNPSPSANFYFISSWFAKLQIYTKVAEREMPRVAIRTITLAKGIIENTPQPKNYKVGYFITSRGKIKIT